MGRWVCLRDATAAVESAPSSIVGMNSTSAPSSLTLELLG
jgi:hypothetical protein